MASRLYVVANFPYFVYDECVRKIIISLFFLLAFFAYLASPQASLAACEIELTNPPNNVIKKDYKGIIDLKTKDENACLGINVKYKIIMYPTSAKDLKSTFYDIEETARHVPVISSDVFSADGKTLTGAEVNFAFEPLPFFTITGKAKHKPDDLGAWTILVCRGEDHKCDTNYAAKGSFLYIPNPAPTPTPAPDQPIIHFFEQKQCVFQYTNDPNFTIPITAKVQEVSADKAYKWWWNESGWLVLPTIQEKGLKPSSNGNLEIQIKGDMLRELTDPIKKDGNDFCVDVAGKGEKGDRLNDDFGGKRRTGSNCIKIFFTNGNPIEQDIDVSCSGANRVGEPKMPPPPPPQCGRWAYLNGTPVPTHEPDKEKGFNGTQAEYIQYNNIGLDGLKCEQVHTAVGPISTDPVAFVRSIFTLVLGISGGVALILIIISGYKFLVSAGNPETIKEATGQLTSAIIGLLFIIFSFVILEVIGVDILRIPGFGK